VDTEGVRETITVDQSEPGYPGDSHDYLIAPVAT
jgi:hypothetical protein